MLVDSAESEPTSYTDLSSKIPDLTIIIEPSAIVTYRQVDRVSCEIGRCPRCCNRTTDPRSTIIYLDTIQFEPSNKEYVLWSTLLKKSHYEPRRYEVGGQLLPSPHFILQLYAGYPLTAWWKYIGYPDIGNQARRAWIRQKG